MKSVSSHFKPHELSLCRKCGMRINNLPFDTHLSAVLLNWLCLGFIFCHNKKRKEMELEVGRISTGRMEGTFITCPKCTEVDKLRWVEEEYEKCPEEWPDVWEEPSSLRDERGQENKSMTVVRQMFPIWTTLWGRMSKQNPRKQSEVQCEEEKKKWTSVYYTDGVDLTPDHDPEGL